MSTVNRGVDFLCGSRVHEKCCVDLKVSQTDVDKITLSAGFWITLVLFVALGYAFADEQSLTASSAAQYKSQTFDNDARASDSLERSRCGSGSARRADDPTFPQVANWQRGGSMYAPGLSFTLTSKSHVTLCPGPVEIPQTQTQ